MEYKDSHGISVKIGDTIVYHHSRTYGNTALLKAQIVSFTNSGKPRVFAERRVWDTPNNRWIQGANLIFEPFEQTLLCNFAKGYPNI